MIFIDINCDVGEGVGNESDLMPLISSCNIACGGHAGDEQTMMETILLAKRNDVKIGAHPSYPDRVNFGRKRMEMSSENLISNIKGQLSNFMRVLKHQKGQLHHIKPHGALYNAIAKDENLANVFLDALESFKTTPIYVPYHSKIQHAAIKRGFPTYFEAFADRNYHNTLELVSRSEKNSLIIEPEMVMEHLLPMINNEKVRTIEGGFMKIKAHTYCIHGDTSSALEILMYLHRELPKHNIKIRR